VTFHQIKTAKQRNLWTTVLILYHK